MNIEFKLAEPGDYGMAFSVATIYSRSVKDGFPIRFYMPDSRYLVSVNKTTSANIKVSHFRFTVSDFKEIWTDNFITRIEPQIKEFPTFSSGLYSLKDMRFVEKADFMLTAPHRDGGPIFFINKEDIENVHNDIRILYFEPRKDHSVSDLVSLNAILQWYYWGLGGDIQGQTADGKMLVTYLYETRYNGGKIPQYLNPKDLRESSSMTNFPHKSSTTNMSMVASCGELFKESRNEVKKKLQGTVNDVPPAGILNYIQKGAINLTELMSIGIIEFGNKMLMNEVLDVSIDVPEVHAKSIYVTKQGLTIIPDGEFTSVFYESILDISGDYITIVEP